MPVLCKMRSGEKLKQANDEMNLEEIVRDKSNIIQHKTETLESVIMEEICHNEEVCNTTKTLSITDDEECCFASARAVNDEIILEEIARDKSNIIQHKTETIESANSIEEICHNEEVRNTT